jgi:aquaporin Z
MKRYFAEFIGTFALVFCGTGAIVINQESGGAVTHVGIAFAFGLVVMVMIYSIGAVSGAHMNPAVTIAFSIAKRFPAKEIVPYIVSQLIGALAASFVLRLLFPSNELLGSTIPAGNITRSFVLEFILTFFLMFVIIQVSTGSKEQGMFAGLAIGSTVLLEAMFAGPICGASMNPARSLSPALVSGHLEYLWIYLVAPLAGAIAAVPATTFIKQKNGDDVH